jgi:hypothetical protein
MVMTNNIYNNENLKQLLEDIMPHRGDTVQFERPVDLEFNTEDGLAVFGAKGLIHTPSGHQLILKDNTQVELFSNYDECLDYKPVFDALKSSNHHLSVNRFMESLTERINANNPTTIIQQHKSITIMEQTKDTKDNEPLDAIMRDLIANMQKSGIKDIPLPWGDSVHLGRDGVLVLHEQTEDADVKTIPFTTLTASQQDAFTRHASEGLRKIVSEDNKSQDAVRENLPSDRLTRLEVIGYPFFKKWKEDGSLNIPTVEESMYWDYAAGNRSLNEAARELHTASRTNFVDEDSTMKVLARLNKKYHKLTDDLKPFPLGILMVKDLLDKMGNPDRVNIVRPIPSLYIPQRFGDREVSFEDLKKGKDGALLVGNAEDGYYRLEKLNNNNLYTVESALRRTYKNRPENLVCELVRQLETGRANVEPHLAKDYFLVTINENPHERNYERGFKQFVIDPFIVNKDHIFLQHDWDNRASVVSVDPKTFEKIVMHTEDLWETTKAAKTAVVNRTTDPSAMSFNAGQAEMIDKFLGKGSVLRSANANRLMRSVVPELSEKNPPLAWVNATTREVMSIAEDYERYKSEHQSLSSGVRR